MTHEDAQQFGILLGKEMLKIISASSHLGLCANCVTAGMMIYIFSSILPSGENEEVEEYLENIMLSILVNLEKRGEAEASPSSSDKRSMN